MKASVLCMAMLIIFANCINQDQKAKKQDLSKSLSTTNSNNCAKDVQSIDTTFSIMMNEHLGNVYIDMPTESLALHLGEPDSVGPIQKWEAIGAYVQNWHFHNQGLTLDMVSDDSIGPFKALSITANLPCTLSTRKKIKLGSTLNELIVAYKTSINHEDSAPDSAFVVGSIYGGLIFQLKDSVVVKIYIGAAAE